MKSFTHEVLIEGFIFTCVIESYDKRYVTEVVAEDEDLEHDFYDLSQEAQDEMIADAIDLATFAYEKARDYLGMST